MPVLNTPAVLFGQVYIPAIENKQNGFELGKKANVEADHLDLKWNNAERWLITGYPTQPSEIGSRTYSFLKSNRWSSLLRDGKKVPDIKLYMASPKYSGQNWLFNYFLDKREPKCDKPINLDEIPIVVTNEDGNGDLTALRRLSVSHDQNWSLTFMLQLFKSQFYLKKDMFHLRDATIEEIDAWVEQHMKPAQ